jgi:hypothetical protein
MTIRSLAHRHGHIRDGAAGGILPQPVVRPEVTIFGLTDAQRRFVPTHGRSTTNAGSAAARAAGMAHPGRCPGQARADGSSRGAGRESPEQVGHQPVDAVGGASVLVVPDRPHLVGHRHEQGEAQSAQQPRPPGDGGADQDTCPERRQANPRQPETQPTDQTPNHQSEGLIDVQLPLEGVQLSLFVVGEWQSCASLPRRGVRSAGAARESR